MVENYLKLELAVSSSFYCPVCGDTLSDADHPELCFHTLFIYDNDTERFLHCDEYYEPVIKQAASLDEVIGRLKSHWVIFFDVTTSDGTNSRSKMIAVDISR